MTATFSTAVAERRTCDGSGGRNIEGDPSERRFPELPNALCPRPMRMLPSQSRNLTRVGPCDRDKEDLPTKREVVRILVAPHDLSRPQR